MTLSARMPDPARRDCGEYHRPELSFPAIPRRTVERQILVETCKSRQNALGRQSPPT